MSATDSDNSIDWLASDNEDNDSEQESDFNGKHSQTDSAPPHLGPSDGSRRRSSEVKEGDSNWSKVREASGRGFPPDCMEAWVNSAIGLCKTQQGEKTNGKNTQQALKRPHGSTEEEEECKERQLNVSEKNRIFSRKVSTSDVCLFPTRRGWRRQQN